MCLYLFSMCLHLTSRKIFIIDIKYISSTFLFLYTVRYINNSSYKRCFKITVTIHETIKNSQLKSNIQNMQLSRLSSPPLFFHKPNRPTRTELVIRIINLPTTQNPCSCSHHSLFQ